MTAFLDEKSKLLLWERRKRWTVEEYENYFEQLHVDIWKVELIDGEIIPKLPKKPPHVCAVMQCHHYMSDLFGFDHLWPEAQIFIDDFSMPEPDISVLIKTHETYLKAGNPTASDVCLAIEVADFTLQEDLVIKAMLYASGKIPEYWVVDITNRRIIQHLLPENNAYTQIVTLSETEEIAPQLHPSQKVSVSKLLP
jgi:Uma2 family endonuclease